MSTGAMAGSGTSPRKNDKLCAPKREIGHVVPKKVVKELANRVKNPTQKQLTANGRESRMLMEASRERSGVTRSIAKAGAKATTGAVKAGAKAGAKEATATVWRKRFGKDLANRAKNPTQKQLNANRREIRMRVEASRKRGKSPPKRGDVTRSIGKAGAKATTGAVKAGAKAGAMAALRCVWAMNVDSGLSDLPLPTKKEATAIVWPMVDTPSWE